uniref:Uncharacterized protein n=1 Tax=Caenorhabditis japonica TaxID=281687 RepID=A0A8R1E9L3_CAEJA
MWKKILNYWKINADPFPNHVKKIPRALHKGHMDLYSIRYVFILPRIHAPPYVRWEVCGKDMHEIGKGTALPRPG